MNYEATIGLGTHVKFKTNTKIFCGCANEFGAPTTRGLTTLIDHSIVLQNIER